MIRIALGIKRCGDNVIQSVCTLYPSNIVKDNERKRPFVSEFFQSEICDHVSQELSPTKKEKIDLKSARHTIYPL